MNIEMSADKKNVTVHLTGEVDSLNAPDIEEKIMEKIPVAEEIIIDAAGLEYISSSGLRMLLVTQKAMKNKGGHMTVKHVSEDVMDVFNVTGFAKLLDIA